MIYAVIFSPAVLAAVLLFINDCRLVKGLAKWFCLLHFAYAAVIWSTKFNSLPYKFVITNFGANWVAPFEIKAEFLLNNQTFLMIMVVSLVFFMSVFFSKKIPVSNLKTCYALLLFFESTVLAGFASSDMFIFLFFWMLQILLLYFLILIFGDKSAKTAIEKLTIFSFCGSLFLLLGVLIAHFYSFIMYGTLNSDINSVVLNANDFPLWVQVSVSAFFLIGLLVRVPLFPLGNWQARIINGSKAPICAIFAPVLLISSMYAFAEFSLNTFSSAFRLFCPYLILYCALSTLYYGVKKHFQPNLSMKNSYSVIFDINFLVLLIILLFTLSGGRF